jgi:hypothetical protein
VAKITEEQFEAQFNTYEDWYGDVVYEVEKRFDMTTSDAQGWLMCREFRLTQAWGSGYTAEQTAYFLETVELLEAQKRAKTSRLLAAQKRKMK